MKFYNPFKPHIVLANDGFWYIRKLTFSSSWVFLKNPTDPVYMHTWYLSSSAFLQTDCSFVWWTEAKNVLDKINERKRPKKFKVIKVLNDA